MLWTDIHLWRFWLGWIRPPSLSPFSTSLWSFPIRIRSEICQVQRSFFCNGRLVRVASRTSTGPSAKIWSISGIIEGDRFPCFNFSKSAQGVGDTIWNWHNLLGIFYQLCIYAYRHTMRTWQLGEQSWLAKRNGPNINLGPISPFWLGEDVIIDTPGRPETRFDDMELHAARIITKASMSTMAFKPQAILEPGSRWYCTFSTHIGLGEV